MARSGTRTSNCSRPPAGLTKAWTVTSLGISCAAATTRHDDSRSDDRNKQRTLFPLIRIVYHNVRQIRREAMKRKQYFGGAFTAAVIALAFGSYALQKRAVVEAA